MKTTLQASSEEGSTVARPARLVALTASAIGLCILGDSLLYSVLPVAAPQLGIPLSLVGVLLSVNRLVRLLTNSWASALFERWGPFVVFTAACLLGLFSTLLYGFSQGFVLFLVARLLWGASWSALRQGGYQAVWSGEPATRGRFTGLLSGIIRLGSALSVLGGGLLFDHYGFRPTLAVVAAVTTLALPVAYFLPWPKFTPRAPAATAPTPQALSIWARGRAWFQDAREALVVPSRRWLTAAGGLQLLSSSVILATSSLFLAKLIGIDSSLGWLGIGTLTGLLQGARWLSDITIGPLLGSLSDRIGQPLMALTLVCLSTLALVGLTTQNSAIAVYCLLLVLLCDSGLSITLSAAASDAAVHCPRPHLFIGLYTTATDFSSAIGPLFALSIGQALGFSTLYWAVGAALLLAVLRYWRLARG